MQEPRERRVTRELGHSQRSERLVDMHCFSSMELIHFSNSHVDLVVVFKVSDSASSSLVVAVGVVMGLLILFALVILLVLLCRSRKVKGERRAISKSGIQ